MTESKEWIGEWYIPFNGEEVVFYGTLAFNPTDRKNDIILKASSISDHVQNFAFKHAATEELEFNYIEGLEHKSGKPIILLKPYVVRRESNAGLVITIGAGSIIECYTVIDKNFNFDFIRFQLSGIKEWFSIRGTDIKLGKTTKDKSEPIIQVSYTQPEKLVFNINTDFDLEVFFSYGIKDMSRFNLSILEEVYLFIKPKKDKQNFYVLTNVIEQLRRLMSVLFNGSCFIMEQSVHHKDEENEFWGNQIGYNVYHRSNYGTFPIDTFSFDRMIVTYDQIREIFPQLLKRWFTYLDNDAMGYVHWVLSKYPKVFSEDVFLEKARALEVFHRGTSNRKLYPDEIKDSIIKKIMESITLEFFTNKNSLNINSDEKKLYEKSISKIAQSLSFVNEPSFSDRLKELFLGIKDSVSSELFKEIFGEYKSLSRKIVEDRNYYTHYSKDRKMGLSLNEEQHLANSNSIKKLHNLTLTMRKALLIIVLHDLGIDQETIIKRLSSRRYA